MPELVFGTRLIWEIDLLQDSTTLLRVDSCGVTTFINVTAGLHAAIRKSLEQLVWSGRETLVPCPRDWRLFYDTHLTNPSIGSSFKKLRADVSFSKVGDESKEIHWPRREEQLHAMKREQNRKLTQRLPP